MEDNNGVYSILIPTSSVTYGFPPSSYSSICPQTIPAHTPPESLCTSDEHNVFQGPLRCDESSEREAVPHDFIPLGGTFSQDPNIIISAAFFDSSGIRGCIEYLKLINSGNCIFSFRRNGIYIQQVDSDNGTDSLCLNDIMIRAKDISYIFNPDPSIAEINLSINIGEFRQTIKTVKKKEGMRLIKTRDLPNYLTVIVGRETQSAIKISVHPVGFRRTMALPEYIGREDYPSQTIQISDFTTQCSYFVSSKSPYMLIKIFRYGIQFEGYSKSQTFSRVAPYGRTSGDGDSLDYFVVGIKSEIVKALSKLNALAPSSSIKIYIDKDKPIMFDIDIGHYGKLRIYVRSSLGK
jgi:hypothetical protein